MTAPLRQGFLTASPAAAAGWDAIDTLAVNLAESGGTLTGTIAGGGSAGRDPVAGRHRIARLSRTRNLTGGERL